jgi:hypothetical protein
MYSLIKHIISESTFIRMHIQCLNIDSSTEPDSFGSYIVADFCIHDPYNINKYEPVPEKAHCCMVLLLQQYGFNAS